MSTNEERELILEYWFRVLIGTDISIANISQITLEFADEYESFDPDLCQDLAKIANEGKLIYKTIKKSVGCNAFGNIITTPDRIYHWKLKIIKCEDDQLNIGIIEADKAKHYLEANWWFSDCGYSYWAGDGHMYHKYGVPYGEKYGKDDIIDVWLNLKENKYELSFAKNDKKYGKAATVEKLKEYRLAIGMYSGVKRIELLSFEITN